MFLLWNGLAEYVLERGIEVMFGAASFHGTDAAALAMPLSYLHHFHRAPQGLRVRARPGSRYAYSNMGYGLLGMVIEKVTGQPYERYLDAQLLQPLGMADSTFTFVTQTGAQADPRLAMGYFEHGVAQPAVPQYLRPAAQFTTTAADMGKLAHFLMGDGKLQGKRFIDPALAPAPDPGRPVGRRAG